MRGLLIALLFLLNSCATTYRNFDRALSDARQARCATAICLGDDAEYALEPLVELPVGKTFSIGGPEEITNHLNNNKLNADFNLGFRVWFLHDLVSAGVYLSEPLMNEGQGIRLKGSRVVHTSLDRPYPGFALGLFGDILWLGFDYNKLYNGTGSNQDPNFRPNQQLGGAWTVSFAIAPVSAFRFGLGSAATRNAIERAKESERQSREVEALKARLSALELGQLDLLVRSKAADQEVEDLTKRSRDALGADPDLEAALKRATSDARIAGLKLQLSEAEAALLRANIRAIQLSGVNKEPDADLSPEGREAQGQLVAAREAYASKKAELLREESSVGP